ncbi:hypothetical protein AMTRI_Chr11g153330 [Amborella trichopoda]
MAWCVRWSSSSSIVDFNKATFSRGLRCLSLAPRPSNLPLLHRKAKTPFSVSYSMSISNTASKTEVIQTEKAPKAVGPYSQGIKSYDLLFLSGALGLVPETGKLISDGIEEQTEQALKNIGEILRASGASYSSVVKTTVLYGFDTTTFIYNFLLKDLHAKKTYELILDRLADMKDFKTVNEIYAKCANILNTVFSSFVIPIVIGITRE